MNVTVPSLTVVFRGLDQSPQPTAINIRYTNYKGEVAVRRIRPHAISYGRTPYHPDEQWFMIAFDIDKNDYRTFALKDMVLLP